MQTRYKVVIPKKSENDLSSIYDYLLNKTSNRNIAEKFVRELHKYIKDSLSYMPQRFSIYKNNIRKSVYPKNRNYIIFFEVNEEELEVVILAITNAKQFTRYSNL